LADVFAISPFILASSIEELATLTESELRERLEEELDDEIAIWVAIDNVRHFLIERGYGTAVAWEERKAAKGYDNLLENVSVAYKKLSPRLEASYSDQLADIMESTLLLARTSAQLIHLVTSELEADGSHHVDYDYYMEYHLRHLSKFTRFGNPLVEAWLEGSAATKGFIDITDKASPPHGEKALEDESENGGGDHQE
jgi:hypothetical protein